MIVSRAAATSDCRGIVVGLPVAAGPTVGPTMATAVVSVDPVGPFDCPELEQAARANAKPTPDNATRNGAEDVNGRMRGTAVKGMSWVLRFSRDLFRVRTRRSGDAASDGDGGAVRAGFRR